MAIDKFKTSGRRPLTYPLQVKGSVVSETLTGDLQLTARSAQYLALDPGGASRNVTLPGADEDVSDNDGMLYTVVNTANAAEDLVVREPVGGFPVATVSQNERATFAGTGGATWVHLGIVTISLS